MKKILLFFLFSIATQAQTFQWVRTPSITFNSNSDLIGYTTTCDPMGNVYTTGFKENAYNYGDIFGDLFYNKYDSNGELLFSKTFTGHGTVYNAVSDSDGNIILAIGYVHLINIDELSLTTVDQSVQALLVKLDKNGHVLWHQNLAIDGSFECHLHAIAVDASDHIYVGCDDFQHSYIRKLSPDGGLIFTISQLYAKSISSVSIDNEGNIYAAGSCAEQNATFAGVASVPPFFYNTFLAKYSPAGVLKWVKYVEDITCPQPQVVAVTPNEVYFSSSLFGSFTFDDIQAEGPSQSFSDVFIAKLNAEGIFQWVREVPGDGFLDPGSRKSLIADSDGNVYFAGATRGTINWNNEITTSGIGFGNDAIILKYNSNGDLLMAKTAGGDSYDRVDAIALDASGAIFVTGLCTANASFDSFQHEAAQYENWPFLAKLTQTALGTEAQQLENISFYPNPSADFINTNATEVLSGAIINMLGQKVADFVLSNSHPVDIRQLAKGTYLIKFHNSKTIKFIKS